MSIFTKITFFKSPSAFPSSYEKIWSSAQSRSKLVRAKLLLKDYVKEHFFGSLFGRFISGHWNRHHVSQVREILAENYVDMDALIYDLNHIQPRVEGSLYRRIEFIKSKLGTLRGASIFPQAEL